MPTVSRSRIVPLQSLLAFSAVALLCAAGAASPALGQYLTPGFHVVPKPVGANRIDVNTISRDGTSFGGTVLDFDGAYAQLGYTYTASTGLQFLNQSGDPAYSIVNGLSDGGEVLVGTLSGVRLPITAQERTFRRAGEGPYEQPGLLPPRDYSQGVGVSGDGQVGIGVARYSEDSQPFTQPRSFRWTAGGSAQDLGPYRFEGWLTQANAISRDGSTIVGEGQYFLFEPYEAWTWREEEGFTILPSPDDAPPQAASRASGVNDDGSIVVGYGTNPSGLFSRGLMWVNGQPIAMPAPEGWRGVSALDVSDDGSVVTGELISSLSGQPSSGAIWTPGTGWLTAPDYFTMMGLNVPSGVTLSAIRSVSSDGTVFGGNISSGDAFIVVVPASGSLGVFAAGMIFVCRRKRS